MRSDAETLTRVAEQGQAIYETVIERRLSEIDHGKLVLIEVKSHDFEITTDQEEIAALRRLQERHENPEIYTVRVGSRAVSHMGGVAPED